MTAAASVALGLVLAVGLAGAFVGLSTSSYWFDELFTKWVIGADNGTTFLARSMSDAHPPTYYALAYAWSSIAGTSDLATRLLSAICAVLAVAIFVWRMPGSLNARLFAGALATSSIFWFYHSQNARSYALGLLLMTLVLSRCLTELEEERSTRTGRLIVTAALIELAAMTHLYMLFACLAALAMMFALRRRLQWLALGVLTFATAGAYYLLVIPRYSRFNVSKTWIPGDAGWIVSQSVDAIKQTYGVFGLLAIALCGLAIVRALTSETRRSTDPSQMGRSETAAIFCFGVAALTFAAGVTTSIITPTFTTRNFLVASPFFWGLAAAIYDLSLAGIGPRSRSVLVGLTSVLAMLSGTIVLSRSSPHNEPYKETASWIRQHRECEGALIPVISVGEPDPSDRAFRRTIEESSYGHYLGTFARPVVIFSTELESGRIPEALSAELAQRAQGHGCPVLAWVSHGVSDEDAPRLAASIAKMAGTESGPIEVHTERARIAGLHSYLILDKLFVPNEADTISGFVFHSSRTGQLMGPPSPQSVEDGS